MALAAVATRPTRQIKDLKAEMEAERSQRRLEDIFRTGKAIDAAFDFHQYQCHEPPSSTRAWVDPRSN